MKSSAPFIAIGGTVVTVVAGIFLFGDQLGLGKKELAPIAPVASSSDPVVPQKDASAPQKAPAEASDGGDATSQSAKVSTETTAPKEEANVAQPEAAAKVEETAKKSEPAVEASSEAVAEAPTEPEATAPSFDVVRVEPDGQTLVAGKAEPGSKVDLKNGDDVIYSAEADQNGDWVMILEEPLSQGVSDLSLAARSAAGKSISSSSSVTVAIPEDGKGELLVVESEPGQASKVLANIAKQSETATNRVARCC